MKRKIIVRITTTLLSLALLAVLLPQTVAHAETALATGFVNTAKLNMRSGVGTGNSIVETLKKDTAVNVYEVAGTGSESTCLPAARAAL